MDHGAVTAASTAISMPAVNALLNGRRDHHDADEACGQTATSAGNPDPASHARNSTAAMVTKDSWVEYDKRCLRQRQVADRPEAAQQSTQADDGRGSRYTADVAPETGCGKERDLGGLDGRRRRQPESWNDHDRERDGCCRDQQGGTTGLRKRHPGTHARRMPSARSVGGGCTKGRISCGGRAHQCRPQTIRGSGSIATPKRCWTEAAIAARPMPAVPAPLAWPWLTSTSACWAPTPESA
ncbi:hypothetical protein FQR65_LT20900 [Abscondita terminalis]|nr:hypothetical protein FQR65_LT20900 [Abscondita terminalis]